MLTKHLNIIKPISFLLLLFFLLQSTSCCDEKTFSFTKEQELLTVGLEEGSKSLLASERDTIEFEVIRVTNDFLNAGTGISSCNDMDEVSWVEFANGTAFFVEARESGFEMSISLAFGDLYKTYEIQLQGSQYNLIDRSDESIITEDAVRFLESFSIGGREFNEAIQIVEIDDSGISSELIYNNEFGILRYTADAITYKLVD